MIAIIMLRRSIGLDLDQEDSYHRQYLDTCKTTKFMIDSSQGLDKMQFLGHRLNLDTFVEFV